MARAAIDERVHVKGYVIGYGVSLILTFAAFWGVYEHVSSEHIQISHSILVPILVALALAQFIVQVVFFLHLSGGRQQWKKLAFWFMILVVVILVGGSIWIMNNLNYNMMDPAAQRLYMHDHESL